MYSTKWKCQIIRNCKLNFCKDAQLPDIEMSLLWFTKFPCLYLFNRALKPKCLNLYINKERLNKIILFFFFIAPSLNNCTETFPQQNSPSPIASNTTINFNPPKKTLSLTHSKYHSITINTSHTKQVPQSQPPIL